MRKLLTDCLVVIMEQTEKSSEEKKYTFTPDAANHRVKSNLIDLTAIQTANQTNEQAAGVMLKNSVGAEAIVADSHWEYALLRGNDRHDDAAEVVGAVNDAANARCFLDLFRESFNEFRQSAEYGKLLLGEQAKWQPTLHDGHGRLIGGISHVLLNPTLPQMGNRPVVEIILPNRDYDQEVASRLTPTQRQALEKGQPVAFLDRRTTLQDDITLQLLINMMTAPASGSQQQQLAKAMTEYRQAQADTKPEDVIGLRTSFQRIVEHTLGLRGFKSDTVLDKMLEVNMVERVTFHPDISGLGRQPIHLQSVPLTYKGVDLQPAQLKNLVMGNTIEVAGITDARRPGLYRAAVHFNLMHNRTEETSKHEELKTDNKTEFRVHQQAFHQRGSDELHGRAKIEGGKTDGLHTEPTNETNSRSRFRVT